MGDWEGRCRAVSDVGRSGGLGREGGEDEGGRGMRCGAGWELVGVESWGEDEFGKWEGKVGSGEKEGGELKVRESRDKGGKGGVKGLGRYGRRERREEVWRRKRAR